MKINEAYNIWANQYDTNHNKTRDLEALALRKILSNYKFDTCLEIGCGTGKNTDWLQHKTKQILGVDFSEEMLVKAKQKIKAEHVKFEQADINDDWKFCKSIVFDIAIFSLVLEHFENIEPIFQKLQKAVCKNGLVYIGELHPFKQYAGSKANFIAENGEINTLSCFHHHLTDYVSAAKANGFSLVEVEEFFDNNDKTTLPRILSLVFKKV